MEESTYLYDPPDTFLSSGWEDPCCFVFSSFWSEKRNTSVFICLQKPFIDKYYWFTIGIFYLPKLYFRKINFITKYMHYEYHSYWIFVNHKIEVITVRRIYWQFVNGSFKFHLWQNYVCYKRGRETKWRIKFNKCIRRWHHHSPSSSSESSDCSSRSGSSSLSSFVSLSSGILSISSPSGILRIPTPYFRSNASLWKDCRFI